MLHLDPENLILNEGSRGNTRDPHQNNKAETSLFEAWYRNIGGKRFSLLGPELRHMVNHANNKSRGETESEAFFAANEMSDWDFTRIILPSDHFLQKY